MLNDVIANMHDAKRRSLMELKGVVIQKAEFEGRKSVIGASISFPHAASSKHYGFNDSDYTDAMAVLLRRRFCEFVLPMDYAAFALEQLAEHWYIRIVSETNGLVDRVVKDWLNTHELYYDELILTRGRPRTKHYADCTAVLDREVEALVPVVGKAQKTVLVLPTLAARGKLVNPPPNLKRGISVARGLAEAHQVLTPIAA